MKDKDYTIKKIEIERNFADDVFKKYRYKRYGIGNCCGSDFDDNVNKKALCDHDENQLTTYLSSKITSVIYTPPVGIPAEDDPNRPDWVNKLCGMDQDEVEVYFYYDSTSLGIAEVQAAYTAAQAWVDTLLEDNTEAEYVNCTNIENNTLKAYHTTVFGERWLDWGTSALTGSFQNSGSCGGHSTIDLGGGGCVTGTAVNVDPVPSRNFGTNDCGSAADSTIPLNQPANNKFWGILQWAQSNGIPMHNGGSAGVNGGANFPTINTIGKAPQATAKNVLVVCFIDEAASNTWKQPYHDKQPSGGTATWNAATDGTGTVTPCWAADHTEFIIQRNLYLAQGSEYDANFYCYPSKPSGPGAAHKPFPLHALGAITSGDQTPLDGTLTVAPINSVTLLTAITTSNPYWDQGYGALDQHGWGINPAEDPFDVEGFNDDLNDFVDIIDCNDSTCFVFRVVNQNGTPISNYSIVLDGGNIGNTDEYGVLRHCIMDASINTHHTLQLCHCFETTGDCSSQDITLTLTEECLPDACPAEPFIACEDPQVDPSGNELLGCLDPSSPDYCPDCTADCAGVVGGTDWSCCDRCADFSLSFSSTDATEIATVCQNDGTIDLTVSNGTPPYTYAWTGPGGFTATTEDLTGLCGGVYVVVVTDSSDPECTETLTVYIDQPPDIVYGCMDICACNFDILATSDDGSCEYKGCVNAAATNFNERICDDTGLVIAGVPTVDCNCDPIGTNIAGWDDCCTYCVYGCMDPLANNYDPAATCDDTCTYNWDCTEESTSNSCENLTDTGLYAGLPEGQLAYIALPANGYQYTDVFTLQFETTGSPTSDPCPGPNGGNMAYITSFGLNMPSNYNMNPAGYTIWNDFITDIAALCFTSVTLNTSYSTIEQMMAAGCTGNYENNPYAMEIEWEFCECTTGTTTLNSCETPTSIDITTNNPSNTNTAITFSQLISGTYPNTLGSDMYFCSSLYFAGVIAVNPNACLCGYDGANYTGTLHTNVRYQYDDTGDGGTALIPFSAYTTWTAFVDACVAEPVPAIQAGDNWFDSSILNNVYITIEWDICQCSDAAGCTCVEMTDGTGIHLDLAACEAATNCCGNIPGCTDPLASNYDPAATVDDGSCEYLGCMDPLATNYDPTATVDDGSCEYMWKCDDQGAIFDSCDGATEVAYGTAAQTLFGFISAQTLGYSLYLDGSSAPIKFKRSDGTPPANVCQDFPGQFGSPLYMITGWEIRQLGVTVYTDTTLDWVAFTDAISGFTQCHHGEMWYNGTPPTYSWSQIQPFLDQNPEPCGDTTIHIIGEWCTCLPGECDCIKDPLGTYSAELLCEQDTENCCAIPGCMDPLASNYNFNCAGIAVVATVDDGCCEYGDDPVNGCMDCGYIYESWQASGWFCNGVTPAITPGGINYNAQATINDGSCIYMGCTDVTATNFNFDCDNYEFVGNNPLGDPYPAVPNADDGCCIVIPPKMTYIPDPNFQARLTSIGFVSGWWDITGTVPGGDYCFTSEIDSQTTLNINAQSINDFTGLQDFTSLDTLWAGWNPGATTIPLTTLVNLTYLSVQGNSGLTSLDVTQNILLTHLGLSYTTLTSIDVTQNVLLITLWCLDSNLTSLDVTNNVLLEQIDCSLNQLITLDISQNVVLWDLHCSNNPALTFINTTGAVALKTLYVPENALTTLDLTTNILLEWVQCNLNQLTSLNITQNTVLVSLNCSSNLLLGNGLQTSGAVALQQLWCHTNQLTDIDVSQNVVLKTFLAHDNQLTSLDIKNGNNINMAALVVGVLNFSVVGNNLLTTINCDDIAYAAAQYTVALLCIDPQMTTWTAI